MLELNGFDVAERVSISIVNCMILYFLLLVSIQFVWKTQWNRKSHNGNIDSCWSTILIFLCFCPLGDLTARVRKMERRRRMRRNQSVNTACSPRGTEDIQPRKHSGRSIWRGDWKTVERHVVTAGKITQHPPHTARTHTHTHIVSFWSW